MADTKITGLLSPQVTTNPATDVLPIVNIADTLMASSGSTRKITVNQLLGAGGTATLASATITGALTGQSSGSFYTGTALPLHIRNSGTSLTQIGDNATIGAGTAFIVGSSDGSLRFQGAGSELMRVNATGLGVGVASPSYKFEARGNIVCSTAGGILTALSFDTNGLVGTISNHSLGLMTNGVVAARIDTTGNVGIGVTPSAWDTANYKALQVSRTAVASLSNIGIFAANWFADTGGDKYIANGTAARIDVNNSGQIQFKIATSGTAGTAITDFATAKMTLTASGELLVGTTTANARLDVRTSASQRIINAISTAAGDASTYGVYIAKFSNDSTTAQRFIGFTINNDGAGSGQINANGASQAAFGSFSDYRLKENIVSLPSQLANILSLRPVEFDYKDGSGHQIGFVAQEIQEVYADTVAEQDGFLTVTGWSKTEARLVSAIKELAAKVQALEAKLA